MKCFSIEKDQNGTAEKGKILKLFKLEISEILSSVFQKFEVIEAKL